MRILLTNDDGISAPGIEALRRAAAEFGEIFVAAPESGLSGCGHQVTTDRPIRVVEVEPRRFAVGGTPADCTRIALRALRLDVDLVLAGINQGGNMGVDVYISGTVAAAREAVLLGVPALAFSQYVKPDLELDWSITTSWTAEVLRALLDDHRTHDTNRPPLWNVNLPHLPPDVPHPRVVESALDKNGFAVVFEAKQQSRGEATYRYRGDYHARPRDNGTDVDVCMAGNIALTRLH